MIAVIADDLSGAAELAGAAANCGLRAEVQTTLDVTSDVDVLALDTNTRAIEADAARIVSEVAHTLSGAGVDWIFKKTDSVLRGHVGLEIGAILDSTGQPRAILVPANPSKSRIIRQGIYYVDCVPLENTPFAADPEWPRRNSRVSELLGTANSGRILLPDVTDAQELTHLARQVDSQTLPAGGVDFFSELLRQRGLVRRRLPDPTPRRTASTIFICGSAGGWESGREAECREQGIPVLPMPLQLFESDSQAKALEQWCMETLAALRRCGKAMMAIGNSDGLHGQPAAELTKQLIVAVARVITVQHPDQIFVEGGATASALFFQFGWAKLRAFATDLQGVTLLKPPAGPWVLVKPGSYPLPRGI